MSTPGVELSDLIADFVDESLEALRGLPAHLESYRLLPENSEPIHAVFRAVHSIKGSASFLGLPAIKDYAHALEGTLDELRKGHLTLNEDLEHAIVHGFDLLDAMLSEALGDRVAEQMGPEQQAALARIAEVAQTLRTGGGAPSPSASPAPSPPAEPAETQGPEPGAPAGPGAAEAPTPSAEPVEGAGKTRFMRVKEERLDEFLAQVSSLFITAELFRELELRMAESRQLGPLVEEMRQINRELKKQSTALQQSVMALRQVSVSGLFAKFPRMARTLASQLGKKVNVQLVGEETEIDKVLVEDLDAPLTHLIRNAVDHGIESPEERTARGKSETGRLCLKAEKVRNRVRITVEDDGRGINTVRLREKAVEKGILSRAEAEALSEQDALELIFHPGLSTVDRVSEVSGRGVGMDVVRATLAEHRGEVVVRSQPGLGTTITLDIPVRDAVVVIDALLVRLRHEKYVVPFEHIAEIAEIGPDDLKSVQGRYVVTIRGHHYDAVPLAALLDLPFEPETSSGPRGAVFVRTKHGSLCLLVDEVLGHRQVVVNSLKEIVPEATKVAGVAPLGGGHLAPVLNTAELVRSLHSHRCQPSGGEPASRAVRDSNLVTTGAGNLRDSA